MAVGAAMAVESQIVGYDTQAIAGDKLVCGAFQFTAIGSDKASFANINTTNLTPGIYDTMNTDAPCIMIYDGVSAYYNYYFIADADDGTERFDLTGWADPNGNLVGDVAIPSTGWWLRVPADKCTTGSFTEAGEVLSDATATVQVAAGLTLAGNPYPVDLDLSKVLTEGITPGVYDTMNTDAPCIMIYDGVSAYYNYYYISDGDDGTERFDLTGWVDPNGNLTTAPIAPAGTGFWLRSATAGTLTFSL